jgi:predicted RNase H-like nuclease (RuvC/YqgF family)
MQHEDLFHALDSGVLQQLLPLGDSVVSALVTLLTAAITYAIGKARSSAEVDNLKAEKKSIEAASGVSTAEAAQIISEAAAQTVQPLLERIKEQRQEITYLSQKGTEQREEIDALRNKIANLSANNMLMRQKFILQGELPPELPPEV